MTMVSLGSPFSRMDSIETEIAKLNAQEVKEVQRHNQKVQKVKNTISYYEQQMKFHTDNLDTLEAVHNEFLELLAARKERWATLKRKRELRVQFQGFKVERLRVSPGTNTSIFDITHAYREWFEWRGGNVRRLTAKELKECLIDEFGEFGGEEDAGKYLHNVVCLPGEE